MGIRKALLDEDTLKLEFFKQVFEKCDHVRVLQIRPDWTCNDFGTDVLGVLGLISRSLLSKLSLLSISEDSAPHAPPDLNSNALTVSIDSTDTDCYMEISKILKTRYDVLKRDPQVCARIWNSQDLKNLMQRHIKELHVVSNQDSTIYDSKAPLYASGEFPSCPQFTHFTAECFHVDNSVPAAFMKAVKDGKFPNLKRIELKYCTMNDCEWPQVPEFSCGLRTVTSEMQKLLLKLTELEVWEDEEKPLDIDRLIPVRLEKLSVLKLEFVQAAELQSLSDVLKQGILPNLSKLFVGPLVVEEIRIKLDTFLREFDPNHCVKLEKIALRECIISAEELERLSEKMSSDRLTELNLHGCTGLTGSLSVLFTNSFLRLNTLILGWCELNSNDLQSLARANVEGKLRQLRHLNISDENLYNKISDLFTHSAQWNQLTTLGTTDGSILNVESEFLTSLEELRLSRSEENQFPLVTRCWSGLKTIQLNYEGITCVADSVERGMFPDLTTVRLLCTYPGLNAISLFKLFKANIVII